MSNMYVFHRYIADRFPDLDFLALTFTRSGEDVEVSTAMTMAVTMAMAVVLQCIMGQRPTATLHLQEARAMLHQLDLDHVKILAKVRQTDLAHACRCMHTVWHHSHLQTWVLQCKSAS